MQLFYAPASPFVRKVLVMASEIGIEPRIERIAVNPWQSDAALTATNPLGKIPALITDDGTMLYDSVVICDYLDTLHNGPRMIPAEGMARWQVLRLQALADGILDAAVLRRMETMRTDSEQSASWLALQQTSVARGLAALEQAAAAWDQRLDIGRIATGCVLGYLDFRFADEPWRPAHPVLARWYEALAQRVSMQLTVPQG